MHETDLVSHISQAVIDAAGSRYRGVPALPVPMDCGLHGPGREKEGGVNQYTDYGQRLMRAMAITTDEPEDINTTAWRLMTEKLNQSVIIAASAERRARLWKRRCLVLSILLGAALFVIEAMIAGRM